MLSEIFKLYICGFEYIRLCSHKVPGYAWGSLENNIHSFVCMKTYDAWLGWKNIIKCIFRLFQFCCGAWGFKIIGISGCRKYLVSIQWWSFMDFRHCWHKKLMLHHHRLTSSDLSFSTPSRWILGCSRRSALRSNNWRQTSSSFRVVVSISSAFMGTGGGCEWCEGQLYRN